MKQTPQSDQALVKSMLAGDEQAFRCFFETYFPRVYRFALPRLGGDVDVTRQVVQGAMTKAMRGLQKFRGDAALFSWLCQICRHEIVDHLRAHKRYSDRVVLIDDSPELQAALDFVAAPAELEPASVYGKEETRRLVQSVLDRLPDRYGDVLEWKYVEGRSVEEIGDLLGVGQIAAQSLLARARVAFREALDTVFGATANDVLAGMLSGH